MMNTNNHMNNYLVLMLFLFVLCIVTIYYKPVSTNIEIQINRFAPNRRISIIKDKEENNWNFPDEKDVNTILDVLKNIKFSYTSSSTTEVLLKDPSSSSGPTEAIKAESSRRNIESYKDHDRKRNRNERPIVGILAQDIDTSTFTSLKNTKYKSYIAASYVKFLESGGARVTPVLIDQPEEYYQMIFNSINGLLIPGGAVDFDNSGFERAGKKMFDMALKANDNGDYWPIWGTCLGFELLAFLAINETHSLTRCSSMQQPLPLDVTSKFSQSKVGRDIPSDVFTTLTTKESTINFHNWCLSPTNFSYFEMDKFWDVLATNKDYNGFEFISLLEAKKYPIWGSQFHPEKHAYEWTLRYPKIPHDISSIHAGAYFAEFLVEETRKNGHKFVDRETEEKHLIYNYPPTFTGDIKIDDTFVQSYFF